jgi:hypothetical protein
VLRCGVQRSWGACDLLSRYICIFQVWLQWTMHSDLFCDLNLWGIKPKLENGNYFCRTLKRVAHVNTTLCLIIFREQKEIEEKKTGFKRMSLERICHYSHCLSSGLYTWPNFLWKTRENKRRRNSILDKVCIFLPGPRLIRHCAYKLLSGGHILAVE